MANTYQEIGRLHQLLQQPGEALQWLTKALRIKEGHCPNSGEVAYILAALGNVHRSCGAWGPAKEVLERAAAMLDGAGDQQHPQLRTQCQEDLQEATRQLAASIPGKEGCAEAADAVVG